MCRCILYEESFTKERKSVREREKDRFIRVFLKYIYILTCLELDRFEQAGFFLGVKIRSDQIRSIFQVRGKGRAV